MRDVLAVALGGAIGSSLRYGAGTYLAPRLPGDFPWHTFAVNISGAFLLGLLTGLVTDRELVSQGWKLFLGVGVLGGYTTFSTLALETVELTRGGALVPALANSLGSIVLGILAAAAGLVLARAI